MTQHIVMQGLLYKGKKDENEINEFFKEKGWGKVKYKMQFKTLPGFGGPGGRTDVVFEWHASGDEFGKFSIGRFGMGANAPRWLEDYLDNNGDIVPESVYAKLKRLREW